MVSEISTEDIIKRLRKSDFILQCKLPLGYSSGLPILQIKNESLCLTVPYLQYKTTGQVDKTLVYPIRYAITLELPTENIVSFENYEYNDKFAKVDFNKPVGYFRHDAIKKYNKAQYKALRSELMKEYDKVIMAIFGEGEYTAEDEKKMSALLQLLTEPSLIPFYRAIDADFYNKYLKKG